MITKEAGNDFLLKAAKNKENYLPTPQTLQLGDLDLRQKFNSKKSDISIQQLNNINAEFIIPPLSVFADLNVDSTDKNVSTEKIYQLISVLYLEKNVKNKQALKEYKPLFAAVLNTFCFNFCAKAASNVTEFRLKYNWIQAMQQKRVKATLMMLQRKGYCTETTFDDAFSRALKISESKFLYTQMFILNNQIGEINAAPWFCKARYSLFKDNIDTIWSYAIQQVTVQYNYSIIADFTCNDFYGQVITHVDELYAHALTYYYFLLLFDHISQDDKRSKEIKAEQENNKTIAQLSNELKTSKKQIKSLTSELRNVRDKQAKTLAEYQMQIADLEREIVRLHRIQGFQEVEDAEEIEEAEETEEITEPEKSESTANKILKPLPEKGVVFLGGHQKLVNKVKQIHPNWTYISTDTTNKLNPLKENCVSTTIIFIVVRHVSHALYYNIVQQFPNTPKVYITATNLKNLERQMQEGYTDTFEN